MNLGRKIKIVFPLKGEVWNVKGYGVRLHIVPYTQILDRNKDINSNVIVFLRSKNATTRVPKFKEEVAQWISRKI